MVSPIIIDTDPVVPWMDTSSDAMCIVPQTEFDPTVLGCSCVCSDSRPGMVLVGCAHTSTLLWALLSAML